MRSVGLHIRRTSTLLDVADKADRLAVDFFQCFLTLQATGRLIDISPEEIAAFIAVRKGGQSPLYAHASYCMNLSRLGKQSYRPIEREIELAHYLTFTHMIVHPGCAKGAVSKEQGVDALAQALNKIIRRTRDVIIVLENTAHGGMSIGSDITDFGLLLPKIEHPERIAFCIDTAHAYTFGYNLADPAEQEAFIALVEQHIGWQRVVLIHLNDTDQKCGSQIDKHVVIGKGRLGQQALKSFILHEKVRTIPVLMELPVVDEEEERAVVSLVRSWHT